MNAYTVSVVIPTYYRQNDLSEMFDSILRQTINPLEIIIVDDTPNEEIKSLCEEYKAKFEKMKTSLIYIRNFRKRSAAIARNIGIEEADGDIIMFFDSDIILYREFIEKTLDVFKQYSNAIGVQGWIINIIKESKIKYYFYQVLHKIFHLSHHSKNSCKYAKYPIILTKIISCETMSGANMSFKRDIFDEFRFDENLMKYSYMEDTLLSNSIFQKYPNSLFMTPYAKIIHKTSKEGRMEDKELIEHKCRCRKYVLKKLFGFKGLLIYHRQNLGRSISKKIRYLNHFLRKPTLIKKNYKI